MSYDINFIKKKDLNTDNVYDILETREPSPNDEIYISKELMKSLIDQFKTEGLEFKIFEGKAKDYFELNFPTYQISMFNSQIAISLPYWDENGSVGINEEIKQIANVFIKNGFTGFDSQTEKFITEPYAFQNPFTEAKAVVDKHVKSNSQQLHGKTWMYMGLGLTIVIVGFILWKMMK